MHNIVADIPVFMMISSLLSILSFLWELAKKLAHVNFFALFLLVPASVIVVLSILFLGKRKRLLANGLRAEGEVTGFKYRFANTILSRFPVIRFVTADNRIVEAPYSVTTLFVFYEKGSKFPVIYDADKPEDFLLDTESAGGVLIWMAIAGGIGMGLWAIYMFTVG